MGEVRQRAEESMGRGHHKVVFLPTFRMRPPPPTHSASVSRRDRSWRTLARTSTLPYRLPSGCWPTANCR
eukprot:6368600-Prorocentrum_lima.AAC.1